MIYNIGGKKYRVVKRTFSHLDHKDYSVVMQWYNHMGQEWLDVQTFKSLMDAKHFLIRFNQMGGKKQVDEEVDFGEI